MTKHCELRESAIILREGMKLIAASVSLLGFFAVHAIRKMEGVAKHKEIAALYGVSRQTIHKVLSGETWKGPDHE